MKITKTITKWVAGAAVAAAMLVAAPKKADAQVAFGVRVGPVYGAYRPYPVYRGYYPGYYGYYGPRYYGPAYRGYYGHPYYGGRGWRR